MQKFAREVQMNFCQFWVGGVLDWILVAFIYYDYVSELRGVLGENTIKFDLKNVFGFVPFVLAIILT